MATVRQQLHRMLDQALGDDPREALIAARRLGEETTWLLQRAVILALRENWSWGRIGRLLGVSRQAARQRFRGLVPTQPPHRRADHEDPYARHVRRAERMMREIANGTWNPDHGEDEVVPW